MHLTLWTSFMISPLLFPFFILLYKFGHLLYYFHYVFCHFVSSFILSISRPNIFFPLINRKHESDRGLFLMHSYHFSSFLWSILCNKEKLWVPFPLTNSYASFNNKVYIWMPGHNLLSTLPQVCSLPYQYPTSNGNIDCLLKPKPVLYLNCQELYH